MVESARLMQFQVAGKLFGLFLGSFTEYLSNSQTDTRSLSVANMIMVTLWLAFTFYIVFAVAHLKHFESSWKQQGNDFDNEEDQLRLNEDSSSSVASEQETDPASVFQHHKETKKDHVDSAEVDPPSYRAADCEHPRATESKMHVQRRQTRLTTYTKRVRKLLTLNIAIPLTMAMIVYTVFSQEVLFSSCALITNRYFSWRGSMAGLFLGSVAVLVLPLDFFCGHVAKLYEERCIVKVG